MPWIALAVAVVVLGAVALYLRARGGGGEARLGGGDDAKPAPKPAEKPAASSGTTADEAPAGSAAASADDASADAPRSSVPGERTTPPTKAPSVEALASDAADAPPRVEAAVRAPDGAGEARQATRDDDAPTGPVALIVVSGVGRTDPGRRGKHNEDSYLVLPEHHVFAIADGMGGHAAGEVASRLAVDVMAEAFREARFDGAADANRPPRGDELARAVQMANRAINAQGRANEAQHGMGTTIVAARFSPNRQRVYVANVGDSRCYRVRDAVITQLTTDHTFSALGIRGPMGPKLTRAVGTEEAVDVDLFIDEPRPGDRYMLCTDGLWKMVPDETLRDLVVADDDLDRACERLVDAANERGGKDNITVILMRVQAAARDGA